MATERFAGRCGLTSLDLHESTSLLTTPSPKRTQRDVAAPGESQRSEGGGRTVGRAAACLRLACHPQTPSRHAILIRHAMPCPAMPCHASASAKPSQANAIAHRPPRAIFFVADFKPQSPLPFLSRPIHDCRGDVWWYAADAGGAPHISRLPEAARLQLHKSAPRA